MTIIVRFKCCHRTVRYAIFNEYKTNVDILWLQIIVLGITFLTLSLVCSHKKPFTNHCFRLKNVSVDTFLKYLGLSGDSFIT